MPQERMYAPDVRRYSTTQPFIVTWNDVEGFHVTIGKNIPSIRMDVLKISITGVTDGKERQIRLEESLDHSLTDGKEQYVLYAPTDKEIETMNRKLKEFGV